MKRCSADLLCALSPWIWPAVSFTHSHTSRPCFSVSSLSVTLTEYIHISPLPSGSTHLPSYCRQHYGVPRLLAYCSPTPWQHVVVSILILPNALSYLHLLFRSQTWKTSIVTENKPSFQTYNLPSSHLSVGEQEKHLQPRRGGICGRGLLRHHYPFSLRCLWWGSKLRKIGLSSPALSEAWGALKTPFTTRQTILPSSSSTLPSWNVFTELKIEAEL